jgi:hypothetical protein
MRPPFLQHLLSAQFRANYPSNLDKAFHGWNDRREFGSLNGPSGEEHVGLTAIKPALACRLLAASGCGPYGPLSPEIGSEFVWCPLRKGFLQMLQES